MEDTNLTNVMERLGKLLAYDRNVQVEVRGSQAYAVPGRVVIPRIETYASLGEHAERMLHGLLDHEVGHANHTDFPVMEEARDASRGGSAKLGALLNSIEDGRIERIVARQFPGAATNLRIKNRWFWTRPEFAGEWQKAKPWRALLSALTLVLRGHVTLAEVRTARADVGDLLAEVLRTHGAALAAMRDGRAGTRDALDVARSILADLRTPPAPPEPDGGDGEGKGESSEDTPESKPSKGKSKPSKGDDGDDEVLPPMDDDESGDAGGSDDAGDDESDDAGDDAGSGDDESDDAGEGAPSDKPEGKDVGEGKPESGGSPTTSDPYAPVRGDESEWSDDTRAPTDPESSVAALLAKEWSGEKYKVFDPSFDFVRDFDAEPARADKGTLEAIERDARDATYALAAAFEAAFRARRERRPLAGTDEGDVALDALIRYAVGTDSPDTIYEQMVSEESHNTVVSIVIDCSGSMCAEVAAKPAAKKGARSASVCSTRAQLAQRAAYAMSVALSQCGIAHEITGFTTAKTDHAHPWWSDHDGARERGRAQCDALLAAIREAERHGMDVSHLAREGGNTYGVAYASAGSWKRVQVAAYAVFKGFDSVRLDGLANVAGIDENLDGEAILWNAQRLAERPERRRIMLVLSDGMPAGSRDARAGAEYLRDTIKRVEAAGAEVYGVGIETNAPAKFYTHSWVCGDANSLAEVALTSLTDIFARGRQECDAVHGV